MEYKSINKYQLKDKGTVFAVKSEKDRRRDNNDLLGSTVLIDGNKYFVKGVESTGLAIISIGQEIGLLVDAI